MTLDTPFDRSIPELPAAARHRRLLVGTVVVLYIALFPVLHPIVDHVYFVIGLVPIIVAGLLLGFRAAIVTVFVVSVAHFGMLAGPLGRPVGQAFFETIPVVTLIVGGTIGYLRDVRVELGRKRDALERQNERLEAFAGVVSHDLRNPLNVATGRLELARREKDTEDLQAVARAHDRMEALIDDVLTLARDGTAIETIEPVDLGTAIEQAWGSVRTPEASLLVETDHVVHCDTARLKRLLENLLRNAVEHGGDRVTVTVGSLENGFYIEDDGPGIPASERESVFEMGYSTATAGTGFGLSIASEIAQAHGWRIRATDGTGGARFEITGVDVG